MITFRKVRLIAAAAALLLSAAVGCAFYDGSKIIVHDAAGTEKNVPKLVKTLNLKPYKVNYTHMLSFSPDGNYLAIVVAGKIGKPYGMSALIWNMREDRLQSRIDFPFGLEKLDGIESPEILWLNEGKALTIGEKYMWDPMTGERLPDNPVIGIFARLNKDKTKMVTAIPEHGQGSIARKIRIYNVADWSFKELSFDGLRINPMIAWTADDNLVMGLGFLDRDQVGKTILGQKVENSYDSLLALVDPNASELIVKHRWYLDKNASTESQGITVLDHVYPNFLKNEVFTVTPMIISGRNLAMRTYHAKDKTNDGPGAFGIAVDKDGRRIYLKGAEFKHGGHAPIRNSVVDAETGEFIVEFDGAYGSAGIDISPDGKTLVLGDRDKVLVFDTSSLLQ